ncbi:Uncharacterized protein SCF082_LOCUS24666, partial [Durusdinium trenchii]
FLCKHADGELLQALETSVPPLDVSTIAIFRPSLSRYEKQVADIKVKDDEKYAEAVARATFTHLEQQLKSDLALMENFLEQKAIHSKRQ